MDRGGGFVFEHKPDGPNGWAVIGVGWLISTALVIAALALFAFANWMGAALASLAQYVGIGALILSGGQFVFMTCRGTALIIEARGRARALEAEAQTRRIATMRQKPLLSEWTVEENKDVGAGR